MNQKIQWTRGGAVTQGLNAVPCEADGTLRRFEELPGSEARVWLEWFLSYPGIERNFKIPELWRFWAHEDRLVRLLSFHAERILRARRIGAALSPEERIATTTKAREFALELEQLLDLLRSEQGEAGSLAGLPALIQATRSHDDERAIAAMNELAKLGFEAFPALRYVLRSLRALNPERVKAAEDCCERITSEVELGWLRELALQVWEGPARESSRQEARRSAAQLNARLKRVFQDLPRSTPRQIGEEITRELKHPSARVRRAVRQMLRSFVATFPVNIQDLISALRHIEQVIELVSARSPSSPSFNSRASQLEAMRTWHKLLTRLRERWRAENEARLPHAEGNNQDSGINSEESPRSACPDSSSARGLPAARVEADAELGDGSVEILRMLRELNPNQRFSAVRALLAVTKEVSPEEFDALRNALIGIPQHWFYLYGVLSRSISSPFYYAVQQALKGLSKVEVPEGPEALAARLRALKDPDIKVQIATLEEMLESSRNISPEEFEALRAGLRGAQLVRQIVLKILLKAGPVQPGDRVRAEPHGIRGMGTQTAPSPAKLDPAELEALRIEAEARAERMRALRDPDINVQIMTLEEMLASRRRLSLDEFEVLRRLLRAGDAVKWRVIELLGQSGNGLPGLRECLQLQAASDDTRTAARARMALDRLAI